MDCFLATINTETVLVDFWFFNHEAIRKHLVAVCMNDDVDCIIDEDCVKSKKAGD